MPLVVFMLTVSYACRVFQENQGMDTDRNSHDNLSSYLRSQPSPSGARAKCIGLELEPSQTHPRPGPGASVLRNFDST